MTVSYRGNNEVSLCQASLMAIVEEWLRRGRTHECAPQMVDVVVTACKFEQCTAIFTLTKQDE